MITTMQPIVRAFRDLSVLSGPEHVRYLNDLPTEIRDGLARYHITPEYLQLVYEERKTTPDRAVRR